MGLRLDRRTQKSFRKRMGYTGMNFCSVSAVAGAARISKLLANGSGEAIRGKTGGGNPRVSRGVSWLTRLMVKLLCQ